MSEAAISLTTTVCIAFAQNEMTNNLLLLMPISVRVCYRYWIKTLTCLPWSIDQGFFICIHNIRYAYAPSWVQMHYWWHVGWFFLLFISGLSALGDFIANQSFYALYNLLTAGNHLHLCFFFINCKTIIKWHILFLENWTLFTVFLTRVVVISVNHWHGVFNQEVFLLSDPR